MRKLAAIESRAAALLLAALVLMFAWLVLVQWWFVTPLHSVDRQIRSLRTEQQRYAGIVAGRDALHARLASTSSRQIDVSAFLAGSDPNAATATLMQHAVDLVNADKGHGSCTVTQKMPLPSSGTSHVPYHSVGASIHMRCGLAPLAAVLYGLAHGKPFVLITTFSAYRNPQPGTGGILQPLNVQMTLVGYMRTPVNGAAK